MPNNIGAFGENFPYSNKHDLNLDWMIQTMKEFKDNYTNLNQTIENGVQSVEETGETAVANVQTAETEALGRIDYAIAESRRRFIFLGDSYGTRTNAQGLTYYDLLVTSFGFTGDDSYFKASSGAAFGHQSGVSFLQVLQSITGIVHPETITDIYVQCGANDIGYTVEQEVAGMNAFMNYVKTTFPKAKCWIFACGLIMDRTNMLKRRLETLATFRNMSVRGFRYILNSDSVLMNTVLLEEDRCHPNQYGVQYIANQIAMAIGSGVCNNAYRAYQSQLNTTLSIDSLASGVLVGYTDCTVQMNTINDISEVFTPERITVGLNLNGITITPSNYINIDMDNCMGIMIEDAKIPVTIANATNGTSVMGIASYEKTENNKYRIRIRPLYNLALGDSNSYFHIFMRFNFINC